MVSSLVGEKVIFVVAQEPFGVNNTCCILRPILREKSTVVDETDFPNSGFVFWPLRPEAASLAIPGRLIQGRLDVYPKYDPNDRKICQYQIERDSAVAAPDERILEVIEISGDRVRDPRDLIDKPQIAVTSHPPTSRVLASWDGFLWGPFSASAEPRPEGGGYDVSLFLHTPDKTVTRVSLSEFAGPSMFVNSATAEVGSHNVWETSHRCEYKFISGSGLQKLLNREFPQFSMESDAEIVRRLAKKVLVRRRAQELGRLLDELEASIVDSQEHSEALSSLVRTRGKLQHAENESDELLEAIMNAGLLDDAMDRRLDDRVEVFVDENAVTLQAELDLKFREKQTELAAVEEQTARLSVAIEEKKNELTALSAEIEAEVARQAELEQQSTRMCTEIKLSAAELISLRAAVEEERARLAELRVVDKSRKAGVRQSLPPESQNPSSSGTQSSAAASIIQVEKPPSETVTSVKSISQKEYCSRSLAPAARAWIPEVKSEYVYSLHLAALATNNVLVPDCSWVRGFIDSFIPETVDSDIFVASPVWLAPADLWNAGMSKLWNQALAEPEKLFIGQIDQMNLSMAQYWALPYLYSGARVSATLGGLSKTHWPENLRLFWSLATDPNAFEVPAYMHAAFSAACPRSVAMSSPGRFQENTGSRLDPLQWLACKSKPTTSTGLSASYTGPFSRAVATDLGLLKELAQNLMNDQLSAESYSQSIRVGWVQDYFVVESEGEWS